jgi:lipopolysaccharide/colanic/teichoic acid biosynthesis glycosyltransferase
MHNPISQLNPYSQAKANLSQRRRKSFKERCRFILSQCGEGCYHLLKRYLDIVAAGLGIMVLAPLFIVVAFLIKLEDRGPLLYWSKRVGVKGKLFNFPKFRSMVIHAEKLKQDLQQNNKHGDAQITFKINRDPRVTRVGRWMRRFSVDELPQLWCVFIGTMTLVGPRPPIPEEVKRYTLKERHRLDVLPGITCIWQVSGRADIPFPQQMEMDLDYVRNRSLGLDITLLIKTIPAVLFGKGAY